MDADPIEPPYLFCLKFDGVGPVNAAGIGRNILCIYGFCDKLLVQRSSLFVQGFDDYIKSQTLCCLGTSRIKYVSCSGDVDSHDQRGKGRLVDRTFFIGLGDRGGEIWVLEIPPSGLGLSSHLYGNIGGAVHCFRLNPVPDSDQRRGGDTGNNQLISRMRMQIRLSLVVYSIPFLDKSFSTRGTDSMGTFSAESFYP